MLVAAVSATGSKASAELIDRMSGLRGLPTLAIQVGRSAVAGWPCPAGLQGGCQHGWIAEGSLEIDHAEISERAIDAASGDFALFVPRDDRVLLASGRAGGHRAIFVASISRDLVVACTRLSPLLPLFAERPPLNREYLRAFLLGHPPPPDCTPYAGILRIPLGEGWTIRPSAPPNRWRSMKQVLDPELRDNGQLAPRLLDAVEQATRRAIRGAKQVGVEVSGGLDSSMIFSLLASFARRGEMAASPEGIACDYATPPWHDDRPYLRSLEGYLGLAVHRVDPIQAAASVGEGMAVDGAPFPSPTLVAIRAMKNLARARGVDVLLTGDGGDQALDGNPMLFGELARRGEIARALRGALRTRGAFHDGPLGRLAHFILRPASRPFVPRPSVLAFRRLRQRAPRWAGPALARGPQDESTSASDFPRLHESPHNRYARLLQSPLMAWWSVSRLQQEVIGGYAVRAPLLDDDFLRFIATLPPLSLFHGGYLRGLMREAMRGLVPEDLRLRTTKGAWCWFVDQALERAGGLRLFSALADVRNLGDMGLVEPGAFTKLFEDSCLHPDHADHDELWRVLSLEAFLRQHAAGQPTSPP